MNPLLPTAAAGPIPVTVPGGYLGAGKTTLLNHLLRTCGGRRLAVLVNDFGDVGIDADLIESCDGDVLSLAGGCVCRSFGTTNVRTQATDRYVGDTVRQQLAQAELAVLNKFDLIGAEDQARSRGTGITYLATIAPTGGNTAISRQA